MTAWICAGVGWLGLAALMIWLLAINPRDEDDDARSIQRMIRQRGHRRSESFGWVERAEPGVKIEE